MNDETIAALYVLCAAAPDRHFDDEIALVRAHADALRLNKSDFAIVVAYDSGHQAGHAAGTAEATAFVVAWLRAEASRETASGEHDDSDSAYALQVAAERLEAGAHLAGDGSE